MKKYPKLFFITIVLASILFCLTTAISITEFRAKTETFSKTFINTILICSGIVVLMIIRGFRLFQFYSQTPSSIQTDKIKFLHKLGQQPFFSMLLFNICGFIVILFIKIAFINKFIIPYQGLSFFLLLLSFAWMANFGATVYIFSDLFNVKFLLNLNITTNSSGITKYRLSTKIFIMPVMSSILAALYCIGLCGALLQKYKSFYLVPAKSLTSATICLIIFLTFLFILSKINSSYTKNIFSLLISQFEQLSSGNKDLTKKVYIGSIDEIGSISSMINNFTTNLANNIQTIKTTQGSLNKQGINLTQQTENSKSEVNKISKEVSNIQNQSTEQTNIIQTTTSAVTQVASGIDNLSQMINSQTSSITEASAAVEEMVGNINSINKTMAKMSEQFSKLSSNASEGTLAEDSVYNKIEDIAHNSENLQIANQVISDIASQTNLLAMNAAIEAAHAGESGKGFAVVSDEIRKLAETSSKNSDSINKTLTTVQNGIKSIVEASLTSKNTFTNVAQQISDTDKIVKEITGTLEEQKEGASQILQALSQMNTMTGDVHQNATEMVSGNTIILDEIKKLTEYNNKVTVSLAQIVNGTNVVFKGVESVSSSAEENKNAIEILGTVVNSFKI